MGFMDKVRGKAQGLAGKNPEKVNQGINKVSQKIDQRTGGKYSQKIGRGAGKAREFLGQGQQGQQGQQGGGQGQQRS